MSNRALDSPKKQVTQPEFVNLLKKRLRVVITGMAGAGKSMFLKYLYVTLCRQSIGKIPIFR